MNRPSPAILGIDPGSKTVGWCLLTVGEFRTGYATMPDGMERPYKLLSVLTEIRRVIEEHTPNRIGIETPWVPRGGERANMQSALKVAGVHDICLVASVWGGAPLSIEDIAPSTAKKALTGRGNATKALMIDAAKTILGDQTLIEDEADAFGIALATWDRIVGVRWSLNGRTTGATL